MVRVPRLGIADSPYRVQVLDRAVEILDLLGSCQEDMSLAELCAALKLHKSTVHRLTMALERHRLVEKNAESGRYRLGLKLAELGSKALAALSLRDRARPHLARLVHETDETVHLCILDDCHVVFIEDLEPQRSVRSVPSAGRRAPAYCTAVGKAMLAALPEADLHARLRRMELKPRTKRTIITPAALKSDLRSVRVRGYAVDDEENDPGVRCVGAAVYDLQGRMAAGISVSGPAFRITKAKVAEVARHVSGAAVALSRELGYETENWNSLQFGSD